MVQNQGLKNNNIGGLKYKNSGAENLTQLQISEEKNDYYDEEDPDYDEGELHQSNNETSKKSCNRTDFEFTYAQVDECI